MENGIPGALFGPADRARDGETSAIADEYDRTGFRHGVLPASGVKDERPSPTPDPAFAKRKATGVTLARGCNIDLG